MSEGREPLPAEEALDPGGLDPLAVAPVDPGATDGREVDLLGVDEAGAARLRRGALGAEGHGEVLLGEDVAAALLADGAEPWLTSRARDTLLGDGRGEVWHVQRPANGEGTAEVTALPVDWAAAVVLPEVR